MSACMGVRCIPKSLFVLRRGICQYVLAIALLRVVVQEIDNQSWGGLSYRAIDVSKTIETTKTLEGVPKGIQTWSQLELAHGCLR